MNQSVHAAPASEKVRASQPKNPQAQATPESKREEFRNYLEHAGVLDALTRVLIGLYEEREKTTNPMEYFLDHLAGGIPAKQELDVLQNEFAELETRAIELEQENDRLREELERRDNEADERERAAIEATGGGVTSEGEDLGEEAEAVTEPETDRPASKAASAVNSKSSVKVKPVPSKASKAKA